MISKIAENRLESWKAQDGYYIPTVSMPEIVTPEESFPREIYFFDDYVLIKTDLEDVTYSSDFVLDTTDSLSPDQFVSGIQEEVTISRRDFGPLILSRRQDCDKWTLLIDTSVPQVIAFETYEDGQTLRDLLQNWKDAKT